MITVSRQNRDRYNNNGDRNRLNICLQRVLMAVFSSSLVCDLFPQRIVRYISFSTKAKTQGWICGKAAKFESLWGNYN